MALHNTEIHCSLNPLYDKNHKATVLCSPPCVNQEELLCSLPDSKPRHKIKDSAVLFKDKCS